MYVSIDGQKLIRAYVYCYVLSCRLAIDNSVKQYSQLLTLLSIEIDNSVKQYNQLLTFLNLEIDNYVKQYNQLLTFLKI